MEGYGTLVRLKEVKTAEQAFKKLSDMGMSYCQLVYKPENYKTEDAFAIKEAAQKQNIKIVSLFAGYRDGFTKWDNYTDYKNAGINSKRYGKARLKYIKQAAGFAKDMGVESVLIHAGFVANNPFSKEYKFMKKRIEEYAKFCKGIGVNVLLETGGESPVTLLRIIQDINIDNLFVNLDTANIIMYGFGNPVDAVYTLKNYIKSVHIKDGMPPVEPKNLGVETPVGEGFVDFERVFAQLKNIGFDGPLIIEREIEGDKQIEDIKKATDYLNRII